MNAKRRLWFHLAMARSLTVGICLLLALGPFAIQFSECPQFGHP
jgi:hypothetical protein